MAVVGVGGDENDRHQQPAGQSQSQEPEHARDGAFGRQGMAPVADQDRGSEDERGGDAKQCPGGACPARGFLDFLLLVRGRGRDRDDDRRGTVPVAASRWKRLRTGRAPGRP